MDTLIRERNGVEEIWYSDDYLKQQIEMAYNAGINRGIRVQFHAVIPMDGRQVDDLTDRFHEKINNEFKQAFENGEVWQIRRNKKHPWEL